MALEDAKNMVDHAFTRDGLKGPGFENTFGGAASSLRRRCGKDLTGADFAVTGIPFDQAVTNRPGTRLGPRAVRRLAGINIKGGDAPEVSPPFGSTGATAIAGAHAATGNICHLGWNLKNNG